MILDDSRTYARKLRANRARLLIDACNFYHALTEAMEKAQHSIFILSWDFDSRVNLRPEVDHRQGPGGTAGDGPANYTMAEFIRHLIARRPELKIRILCWDYPLLYQFEREFFTRFKMQRLLGTHGNFVYDSETPVSGSHHQKVVVIDDRLAFVGGLDLTGHRWDTREHLARQPLRLTPSRKPYRPFHDVQWMVEGPIVTEGLAQMARERWQRATRQSLSPPRAGAPDTSPWPESFDSQFEKVTMAMSLTRPRLGESRELRQVESITVRAIREARELIYIENQYLTSDAVCGALIESLGREQGPEIVIVLPKGHDSLFEKLTMGLHQQKLVRNVIRADRHQRLGLFYPAVPDLEPLIVMVHAKVLIVDDSFVKVGSSNLNNRSMGLDTEADLSLEATPDDHDLKSRIRAFRNDLVGEHLGRPATEIDAEQRRTGSLLKLIDSDCKRPRCLRRLPADPVFGLTHWFPRLWIIDPDRPTRIENEIQQFNLETTPPARKRYQGTLLTAVLMAVALAALLWWRPLPEWQRLAMHPYHALASLAVIYFFAGLFLTPLAWLWIAGFLVFNVGPGFAISILGSLFASAVSYGVGRVVRPNAVVRFARKRSHGLVRRFILESFPPGVSRVMLLVGPTPLISLVAGAARRPLASFLLFTFFRLIPLVGWLAIAFALVEAVARHLS